MDSVRDALESMVSQFAYRSIRPRRKWYQLLLGTGGFSALEEAFDAFGWQDPHVVVDPSPGAIADLEKSPLYKPGCQDCRAIKPMKQRSPPGKGICLRYMGHPDFHIDYRGIRWDA